MSSTIVALCGVRLLQFAAACGIDPARLPKFEPPPGDLFDARVPYDDLLALWEAVIRLADDPGLPVRIGECATAHDYDAVGFVCMTQPTLREAIHQCVRYSRLWTDVSEWKVESDSRSISMVFTCPEPQRLGVRCASENVLAEMLNAGRKLTGIDYPARVVRFRHPKPRDTSVHERFFQAPIEWNAPRNELAIDGELANLPLLKADAALAAFFERHVQQILDRQVAGSDGVTQRVRSFLLGKVGRGAPTLEAAAASLAMGSRTLKRRLQDEGTTFQDVLDGVRCELAKRYLGEQRFALGEVAFLLGFSEPSAFHRAFKRWTGRTPLAYRQAPSAA